MARRQSRRRPGDRAAEALERAAAAERAGDGQAALAILLSAVRARPDAVRLYGPLARRLTSMRFEEAGPAVAEAVTLVLNGPGVDPQPLAPAAISLLRSPEDPLAADFIADPLLLTLLERCLLPNPELEATLTAARRALAAKTDPTPAEARFAIALARQAQLNGWMWRETEAETAAAERPGLTGETTFGWPHIRHALYRPLADIEGVGDLAENAKAPWRDAATALALEPLEERRLAAALPRLGFVENAATEAVREQYDAYPYPRWTATTGRRPRPIAEVARDLFPAAELPDWPRGRLDVLIAGCGAGKHAADVASRFQGAEILAVDLSRTALGYAARALKIARNVRFAEADIMALADDARRFDHIESVGVLHHMPDPLAGWRVLAGLLKPGGGMRVGFYCRRGRSRIKAAREALAAAGFHGRDDDDLRRARAFALDAAADHPARLATAELDFYAASGARDFLFHAQEAEYTPAELADMVDELGLVVVGLELTDPEAAGRYRARFPDDPAMADLRRWDEIEQEAPDTFRHMCQFWLRKPA